MTQLVQSLATTSSQKWAIKNVSGGMLNLT